MPSILVVPFEEDLLYRARRHPLIIRLNDEHDIGSALDVAARHHLALQGLWVETSRPLSAIDWNERWTEIGIALFVPSAGPYRELRSRLPGLRHPALRVFLPVTSEENILAVRMLATLNVQTAVIIKGPDVLWKPLAGLVEYALLRFIPRVAIEPLHFLAASYEPDRLIDYSTVYFDDPRLYLHVDREGRVALAADDARREQFVAGSIDKLPELEQSPAFIERIQTWRASSLEEAEACADCDAWGVCLGKFAAQAAHDLSCQRFFRQMIQIIGQGRARMNQGSHSWPP